MTTGKGWQMRYYPGRMWWGCCSSIPNMQPRMWRPSQRTLSHTAAWLGGLDAAGAVDVQELPAVPVHVGQEVPPGNHRRRAQAPAIPRVQENIGEESKGG